MKVHCFFEQSGTFKNEFKKLGHEAYDYDMTKATYEKMGAKNRKVARSMIHPDYANRFIREFIL